MRMLPYTAASTATSATATAKGAACSGRGRRSRLNFNRKLPNAKKAITSRKEMVYTPASGAS